MWGISTVVGAFALALVAMSFAFAGGAVIVAVPVAIIAVAIAGFIDLNRRRKQAKSLHEYRDEAKADKVEFTDRDERTLVSE